jgi:hypothetical protein
MPEELNTPEACVRYVLNICGELDQVEHEYEAFRRRAEAEGDEVGLVQAHVRMNRLRQSTMDATFEAMRRRAALNAEAQQRAND